MASIRDHKQMEQRRRKAARMFARGCAVAEVAGKLGVSRQAANGWRLHWRKDGEAGLRSKGAAGPKRRLSAEQAAQVVADLVAGPTAQGYATELWTLPRVAKLIKQRTGQAYHPGHVWRVLRALGFSCQRPARRAIERDEPAIKRWKKSTWPRLKKKPVAKDAPSPSSTRAD